MEIGDLVIKTGGWGKEAEFTGIVLGFHNAKSGHMIQVLSEGKIEFWHSCFAEVVDEKR